MTIQDCAVEPSLARSRPGDARAVRARRLLLRGHGRLQAGEARLQPDRLAARHLGEDRGGREEEVGTEHQGRGRRDAPSPFFESCLRQIRKPPRGGVTPSVTLLQLRSPAGLLRPRPTSPGRLFPLRFRPLSRSGQRTLRLVALCHCHRDRPTASRTSRLAEDLRPSAGQELPMHRRPPP